MSVAAVGRDLIRDGREIVVAPAAAASERDLRLFLFGSAFGALFNRRRLILLHAKAIDFRRTQRSVLRPLGRGQVDARSLFNAREYPVHADDVCVLGFDHAGCPVSMQGLRRLRLRQDALEARAAARPTTIARSTNPSRARNMVPTALDRHNAPVRPAAIYLLDRVAEGTTEPRI